MDFDRRRQAAAVARAFVGLVLTFQMGAIIQILYLLIRKMALGRLQVQHWNEVSALGSSGHGLRFHWRLRLLRCLSALWQHWILFVKLVLGRARTNKRILFYAHCLLLLILNLFDLFHIKSQRHVFHVVNRATAVLLPSAAQLFLIAFRLLHRIVFLKHLYLIVENKFYNLLRWLNRRGPNV